MTTKKSDRTDNQGPVEVCEDRDPADLQTLYNELQRLYDELDELQRQLEQAMTNYYENLRRM